MSDDMFYCSFVSIHYIICECGETFPSEEDLRVHLERDHAHKKERKEYKCGICDSLFNTEEECLEHYGRVHMDIQSEHDYVEVYPQEEVDEKDEDLKNVLIIPFEHGTEESIVPDLKVEHHIKVEEKVKIKTEKKPKPNYNLKNIVCEVCGKRYASNAALKYHQRVHTGERPYKCTMCPKSFTMPLFLQVHLRTHTGERPYVCPLCPKAFSNKAALLRHDRVHTGIKPYECPRCGKFFTQSNSMKLHVNTVHLKMPAPYKKTKKIRPKDPPREVALASLEEDNSAVDSISQEHMSETVYIKTEDVDTYEEGDVMLEDVGQDMITYEVVYDGE